MLSVEAKARALLRKVRTILSDPERSTKGTLARDISGIPVTPTSTRAVKFCAAGAMIHVDRGQRTEAYHRASRLIEVTLGLDKYDCIVDINDGPRGRYRIVCAIDRTLKKDGRRC